MTQPLRFLLIFFILLLLPLESIQAADLLLDSILSPTPTWTSEGVDSGVEYGISVASAGDINKDGYADAIIGAQRYLVAGQRAGSAFIFLGGPQGLSNTVHRQLTTSDAGSLFGGAVSGAGDVNGDGFADVIVGASHHHQTIGYDGAAYVYLGSADGLSDQPAWSKVGPVGNAEFGYAVSSAGDVNNDDFDDILVGARTYNVDEDGDGKFDIEGIGAVFLFLGSASGPAAEPAWSFTGEQPFAQLGSVVTGACDLNADGYDDIAVSAPLSIRVEEDGSKKADAGSVYVFLGKPGPDGLNSEPAWSAAGNQIDERFGSALSCAGDVDRNGYPDLAVGARGFDGAGFEYGAAYLFYNTAGQLSKTAGWMAQGSQDYSGFGVSIAIMGDANKDGYADLAVGAPRYTDDQKNEGSVFVYPGGVDGLAAITRTQVNGNKAETDFGYSIASAGDVNANGKADLLIGAPLYKLDEKIVMGRAFLYNGVEVGEIIANQRLYLPLLVTNY